MDLEASLTVGPHALLSRLHGSWRGTATLWFTPGEPHAVDDVLLHAAPVAGGRSLRIDTETHGAETTSTGQLLLGYHLDEAQWQCVWSDSMHTGTQLMWLTGDAWQSDMPANVRGSYRAGADEWWGWHVTVSLRDEELVVLHENVTPDGNAAPGLEWRCRRDHS